MPNTNTPPPYDLPVAVPSALPGTPDPLADLPMPSVPAQPPPLDFAGLGDSPFAPAGPALTAWWMLGGDGD